MNNSLNKNKENNDFRLNKFISDINQDFTKFSEKEVEVKIFFDDFNVEKIKLGLLNKLSGKILFAGLLKDLRFYDNINYSESFLNKKGIRFIRVREENNFVNKNKKFYFTVKKIGDDGYNLEYEKEVNFDFIDKLNRTYGLKKIKETEKERIEIEFFVKINGKKEKLKLSIDKYLDNINKNIPCFLELEAKTREILEEGIKLLIKENIIDKNNIKLTYGGPKKINKNKENYEYSRFFLEEREKNTLNKQVSIYKDIVNYILLLYKKDSIYFTLEDFFKRNDLDKENLELEIFLLKETRLKKFFKLLFLKKLKEFSRLDIIVKKRFEKISNNGYKKFYDKFEREFEGYFNVFILSILDEIKNKKTNLNSIINSKIDSLTKILFIFDDTLLKEELLNILKLDKNIINNSFNYYKNNLKIINNNYSLQSFNIWEQNNKTRILSTLFNIYSRAIATTGTRENTFFSEKDIFNKLKILKINQFEFLAKRFSHWLNSPKRDIGFLKLLKNLFLEDFYHIFLLHNSFPNSELLETDKKFNNFNQDFVSFIFNSYKKVFFSKNCFKLKEKGPNLLEYFLTNIFEDIEDISKYIEDEFKMYNMDYNSSILRKNTLFFNKTSKNKFFLEKFSDLEDWEKNSFSQRLLIVFNKILKLKFNGFGLNLYKKFSNKDLDNLIEIYLKDKKLLKSHTNDFIKEKKLILKEIILLENYFIDNKIEDLDDNKKIEFFLKNDLEIFHLLVSIFDIKVKKTLSKIGLNQDDYVNINLYSTTFEEELLSTLNNKILIGNDFEFITATSSTYNISVNAYDRSINLHDRIGNSKSINLVNDYFFEKDGKRFYLKDLVQLYIHKNNGEFNFKIAREWIERGLNTVRGLLNGEDNIYYKDYYSVLENLGLIGDQITLKKVFEFQKFIYKVVLPSVKELEETNYDYLNKFSFLSSISGKEAKITVAGNKTFESILRKTIIKGGGYIEIITDGVRGVVKASTISELKEELNVIIEKMYKSGDIKNLRFEDKIGNLYKTPKRKNGYRDATLLGTTKNGETFEIQFHLIPYYYIKTGDIRIFNISGKKIMKVFNKKGKQLDFGNINIADKMNNKGNLFFTDEEKKLVIDYCKTTNKKLPKFFVDLYDIEVSQDLIDEKKFLNADYTYSLERTLGKNYRSIKEKLLALDNILFYIANGQVIISELK